METVTPQQATTRLISNNELFCNGMADLVHQIMNGQIMSEQTAAILTGLWIRVETVSEITAAVAAMCEFANKVPARGGNGLVDIVGTGGDDAKTFSISTAAMSVAMATGTKAAKHGGRSMSSSNGAADVMEQMGAALDVAPEQVAENINKTSIGFMFAPSHHSAMRYVAPARRAFGFRSIFNTLGPSINPADAPNQLLGVFHVDLCDILPRVLQQLGSEHVLVVCGEDGLDEVTIAGETCVAELKDGTVREYGLNFVDYGIETRRNPDDIKVANSRESLLKIQGVLDGECDTTRDIVLLNATAALYTGNVVPSLAEDVDVAGEAVDSGKAKAKRSEFITFAKQLA